MRSRLLLKNRRLQTAILCFCFSILLVAAALADDHGTAADGWYKGQIHAHSVWSDGDEFPEVVADWYKSHGYNFLALSDHNLTMSGEKWKQIKRGGKLSDRREKGKVLLQVVTKCQERFGADWLETRELNGQNQVKLKTYEEVRAKLEEPGKFLFIQGEEITTHAGDHEVHISAINLADSIAPKVGQNVVDTILLNLKTVREQAERLGRPILAVLNHPNFEEYDVSAEDLAAASGLRFFEVFNAYPGAHHYGDATHPGVEKLWDIANTIRLSRMNAPPLYGVAGDDTHRYHGLPGGMNPGRGWIVVHAKRLSADALIDAMRRGDFYCSTGVTMRKIAYDSAQRSLAVEVQAEPGVRYTIDFIGTCRGVDPVGVPAESNDSIGRKAKRPGRNYSPEVGKILARVQGASASYKFTGKELYVRAVVRSDKPVPDALPGHVQTQEAWCQPVGWQTGGKQRGHSTFHKLCPISTNCISNLRYSFKK